MGKLVNMTGIELEQCVLDNDELEYIELGTTEQVVEISEEEEFIREYIEQDMDNNPIDDLEFNKLLEGLSEPEVLPSCKDYKDWKWSQTEYVEYEAKVMFLEGEVDELLRNRYEQDVIIPYRKELRDWWFKRKQDKLDGQA